jgi:sensor histidine kinase regulating citrate/malate metabolism
MEIRIKGMESHTIMLTTTARHAATLVQEGVAVWATQKEWARINKRGRSLFGEAYSTSGPYLLPFTTERLLLDMAVREVLEQEGGVEDLWETLEIIGVVPEWNQLTQSWEED